MILVKTEDLALPEKEENDSLSKAIFTEQDSDTDLDLVPLVPGALTKSIGPLLKGKTKHYYSDGNFNLMRLIFHLLKTTGPSHVFLSTYSISQTTLEQVQSRLDKGELLSIKFLIDNRVKVMSPKPFAMMKESFPYSCISLHAKVALVYNEDWNLSIVTSQNATDNPKLERGVIFTDEQIFNYDREILFTCFERGTD